MATDKIEVENFSAVPICEGLGQPNVLKILKICERVAAKASDPLIRQRDTGDSLFI